MSGPGLGYAEQCCQRQSDTVTEHRGPNIPALKGIQASLAQWRQKPKKPLVSVAPPFAASHALHAKSLTLSHRALAVWVTGNDKVQCAHQAHAEGVVSFMKMLLLVVVLLACASARHVTDFALKRDALPLDRVRFTLALKQQVGAVPPPT